MIIKLKPIPITKIWGGNKLSKMYGFHQTNIGEIWGISAHASNSNKILNGVYKNMSLRELYISHRELFGNYSKDEFPLLFKIIDAKSDLSIQVHPDDNYASINENSYGKDECWYILDADDNSKIQIGHSAKSHKELQEAISNNSLLDKLKYFSINPGNYFYIPAGKIHAICKNTTLLEVSQSSDVTYRLYDYNRLDNGKLRELHIEKALEVIKIPDITNVYDNENKYFSFKIKENRKETRTSHIYGDYIYIINGIGYINDEKTIKGEFLVITSKKKYTIKGNLSFVIVNISK